MTVAIRVKGLAEVKRMLGADYKPAMRAATQAIAKQVEGEVARPPGPVTLPIEWASERQRRFVMARKRREGMGPYKRGSSAGSQDILHRWAVGRRGDVGAVLANTATYAKWVQSAKFQQPFHHNTGWPTDEAALRKVVESGAAKRIMAQAIIGALRRRGVR